MSESLARGIRKFANEDADPIIRAVHVLVVLGLSLSGLGLLIESAGTGYGAYVTAFAFVILALFVMLIPGVLSRIAASEFSDRFRLALGVVVVLIVSLLVPFRYQKVNTLPEATLRTNPELESLQAGVRTIEDEYLFGLALIVLLALSAYAIPFILAILSP